MRKYTVKTWWILYYDAIGDLLEICELKRAYKPTRFANSSFPYNGVKFTIELKPTKKTGEN
jgi:hypothetical protein